MKRDCRGVLPEYCSYNTDRHGKRRVRFRKGSFSTYLPGIPWSMDFMRVYAAALEGVKAKAENIGESRTKPGSINALIVSYCRSPEFRGLKASTQTVRRGIIERFRMQHGEKPVKLLERRHIKTILGSMASTPAAANNLLKVLKGMLNVAVDMEMIGANPAIGIKRYKIRGDGIHTWTEDEIIKFDERHPIGSKARLAKSLLLFTGQRRSDITGMGFQHLRGDKIFVRQQKTDQSLAIPLHPELRQALSLVPKNNLTFLLTEFGRPFSEAGFGNWFRDQCNLAGLPQCSAHGLRKAAATRLANAGCTEKEVAAITGHKTLSEVARYTKAANQERLAEQALKKQIGAEREQELSNQAIRLDKTGGK